MNQETSQHSGADSKTRRYRLNFNKLKKDYNFESPVDIFQREFVTHAFTRECHVGLNRTLFLPSCSEKRR